MGPCWYLALVPVDSRCSLLGVSHILPATPCAATKKLIGQCKKKVENFIRAKVSIITQQWPLRKL